MENEDGFKILFWTASIMMLIFSSGILLFLLQTYHSTLLKINEKAQDNLPETIQEDVFSKREKEVLILTIKGYSALDIADKLHISQRTVESHKRNMMEKTDSKKFVSVIQYVFAYNIFSSEELKN